MLRKNGKSSSTKTDTIRSSVRLTTPSFRSIKSQLLGISFFLVVIPVMLVGFQVYNTFQAEVFANTEKDLKNIARDWFNTTQAYIFEEDRVIKREEFLYG